MAKTREPGRFVTLKSGRVIFIPAGKRSKWADVRDEILGGKRREKGKKAKSTLQDIEYRIRIKGKKWSETRTIRARDKPSAHRKLVGPHLGKIEVEWR